MKPPLRDNIYKEGTIVFTKSEPKQKLFIRRYVNRIYFCRIADEPDRKELTLFEREITDQTNV